MEPLIIPASGKGGFPSCPQPKIESGTKGRGCLEVTRYRGPRKIYVPLVAEFSYLEEGVYVNRSQLKLRGRFFLFFLFRRG